MFDQVTLPKHGIDIDWTLEWARTFCWSWLVRDMSLNTGALYSLITKY